MDDAEEELKKLKIRLEELVREADCLRPSYPKESAFKDLVDDLRDLLKE